VVYGPKPKTNIVNKSRET